MKSINGVAFPCEPSCDAVVAGAGIWGCTVARRLAEAGKRVLVLEKRPVVGGNVRCETDPDTGIEIHAYGSHIFHTHLPEVWAFVNRFVAFNGYQHKVLARTKALPPDADARLRAKVAAAGGRTYHLPLGLTLINKFFDVELAPGEVAAFMKNEARAKAVFDAFFRGYTSKQWGQAPEEIDPSIIRRVPVRGNYDTNYFNDYWQGIPADGYNALFDRLLDHPNIAVRCNCELVLEGDALRVRGADADAINALLATGGSSRTTYYSGPLDALFGHRFGHLPWRTLRFERETLDVPDFQGTSVVNYTDADVPYTRIHEFKHYHPEGRWNDRWGVASPKTVIMREYSATWQPGDEPYYPISNPASAELLARYQAEAERISAHGSNGTLVIGGRLGGYKYYDMDKSIEAALNLAL